MIEYGLTLVNQLAINERAKLKSDGVYTFRGVMYRVLNNRAIAYACKGQVLQNWGGFNALLGEGVDRQLYKKALMEVKS